MIDSLTNGCPEPEVLAAYVDRGLSLAERARVDAHLASCPQCIGLVAGVVRTVADVSAHVADAVISSEATPLVTRRSLAGALAAAAAVIAVVAAPSLVRPWLERDAGLVSLVESVGEQRSVLGRLTGGFPHAPLGVSSAGGQDGRAAGTDRVQLTAGKIRESFGARETPSQLHALGVSQLLSGRYDDAAQSLLAASREQPANAQYLNDVAAVQLERARRGLRPDDLPRALAAADRARRLDPSLKEAWFNRALAVSALSLTAEAKASWTEYLKRDSVSPWATEARTHLAELSKPIGSQAWRAIEPKLHGPIDPALAEEAVRTHTTEARNFVENVMFVEWADTVLRDGSGDAELNRLRTMAEALLRVSGDSLYRDAVATIERAAAGQSAAVTELARAHRNYSAAATIVGEDRFAEAEPALVAARDQLARLNSPFAHRASLDPGAVASSRGRGDDATRILTPLRSIAVNAGYAFVEGRATWQLALIAFGQGRLGDAEARYEQMLATFERMGDAEQVGATHNLLASLFGYLGDEALAWNHRTEALEHLNITSSTRLRYQILVSAASAVRRQDAEAALVLQDALLGVAREWKREGPIAEAQGQRAAILAQLGRAAEARSELVAAKAALGRVADQSLRQRLEVAMLLTESDLLRSSNPEGAVTAATRALGLVNERREHRRLAQLNLRLAKANIVWGHLDEAETALARGLQAFEEERASITDEGRLSVLDESWQLLDISLQLSLKKGDYARAFDLSERSRMRSVAEFKRVASRRSLAQVQEALAADGAVVSLSQFEDELAIWVIRRDIVNVTLRPLARRDAENMVTRHQGEIWQGSATPIAGRDLYNEILRPIARQLRGVSQITFVPDATYEEVAFAALWNGLSRRFLVEEFTVTMAPSVGAFAAAREGQRSVAPTREPLILSGPDHTANQQAEAVAGAYVSAALVTGASATRTRLLQETADRRIVHVAANIATNKSYPLLSRILLADEAGQRHSGAVLGRDIASRSFARTDLVVVDEVEHSLSNRGEGTLSLARAFMASGVRAVLGTLPGANENAVRDLMIGFHREMAKNVSAEQALTTVQRNAIQQNGRRLGAWTALVLYGSDR